MVGLLRDERGSTRRISLAVERIIDRKRLTQSDRIQRVRWIALGDYFHDSSLQTNTRMAHPCRRREQAGKRIACNFGSRILLRRGTEERTADAKVLCDSSIGIVVCDNSYRHVKELPDRSLQRTRASARATDSYL
jgi:hypothetical protein